MPLQFRHRETVGQRRQGVEKKSEDMWVAELRSTGFELWRGSIGLRGWAGIHGSGD